MWQVLAESGEQYFLIARPAVKEKVRDSGLDAGDTESKMH